MEEAQQFPSWENGLLFPFLEVSGLHCKISIILRHCQHRVRQSTGTLVQFQHGILIVPNVSRSSAENQSTAQIILNGFQGTGRHVLGADSVRIGLHTGRRPDSIWDGLFLFKRQWLK